MSAFIVSDNNVLIIAIAHLAEYNYDGSNTIQKYPSVTEVVAEARALLQENYNSYNERYQQESVTDRGYINSVTITDHGIRELINKVPAIQIIKAIHCYQYQSCEHEGWESSWSYKTTNELIVSLVSQIPGYENATWGIE